MDLRKTKDSPLTQYFGTLAELIASVYISDIFAATRTKPKKQTKGVKST